MCGYLAVALEKAQLLQVVEISLIELLLWNTCFNCLLFVPFSLSVAFFHCFLWKFTPRKSPVKNCTWLFLSEEKNFHSICVVLIGTRDALIKCLVIVIANLLLSSIVFRAQDSLCHELFCKLNQLTGGIVSHLLTQDGVLPHSWS